MYGATNSAQLKVVQMRDLRDPRGVNAGLIFGIAGCARFWVVAGEGRHWLLGKISEIRDTGGVTL
jgi:hypothetical protein